MSTILNMGIPNVSTGIGHPKHKNRWRVTFANMGGGTDSIPVSAQCTNFARPKLTHAKIELHRYNSVAYIAGKHSWDPTNFSLEDDVTSAATTVIQEQEQRQQWLIGAQGAYMAAASEGAAYKFVTYFDMLDGNDQVLERWTLEGCWFENVNWGEVDYSTGDPVKIDIQMSYDHARQTIYGYNGDTRYGGGGQGMATGGAGL